MRQIKTRIYHLIFRFIWHRTQDLKCTWAKKRWTWQPKLSTWITSLSQR